MSKKREPDVSENPLYHDTWTLLRKYRDVVWSLELSVQRVRRQFQIEFGSSIEDFLESIYTSCLTKEVHPQAKSLPFQVHCQFAVHPDMGITYHCLVKLIYHIV